MFSIITASALAEPDHTAQYDSLIYDISKGNRAALHTLYDSVSKKVYGFALSITKNTYDAEDVLQDTFLTISQKSHTYKPEGKPLAWIFTITRNYALMKLRERSKTDSVNDHQPESSDAFAQIEDIAQRLVLQSTLNILSDDERQILMLHAVGGLKNREIGAVLGIPLNTVLSKYHRTVKKMQVSLKEAGF